MKFFHFYKVVTNYELLKEAGKKTFPATSYKNTKTYLKINGEKSEKYFDTAEPKTLTKWFISNLKAILNSTA